MKTTTTNFIEATLTRAREIIIIEIQMAFYIAIGCKLCTARWMNQSIWKMMAKFLIKFYSICLGVRWRWSKIDMYGISVDKSNVNWVEFRFSKKQPMKPMAKDMEVYLPSIYWTSVLAHKILGQSAAPHLLILFVCTLQTQKSRTNICFVA